MTPDPIKGKLQELCPDVMELKFGCEIRWTYKDSTSLGRFIGINDVGDYSVELRTV
jgi:hypothetical protein